MKRPGIRTRKAQRELQQVLDPEFRRARVVKVPPRQTIRDRFTAWIRSKAAGLMKYGLHPKTGGQ